MNVNTLKSYLNDSDLDGSEEIFLFVPNYSQGPEINISNVELVKNLRGNKNKRVLLKL